MSAHDDVHLDAAAAALGLTLSPQSREAVAANQALLARMAAILETVALDPHDDPLPLFRP